MKHPWLSLPLIAACGLCSLNVLTQEAPPVPLQPEPPRKEARPAPPPRRDAGPAMPAEFRELRRERAQLLEKLERVRQQEGQQEAVADLKRRIAKIDGRMGELDRNRPSGEQRRPGDAEMRERIEHLSIAIEHLRAAGLPDPAEQLARVREEMMRKAGGRPGPGPEALAPEIRRLRAELDEVRQNLRQLNEKMERFHAERR